MKSILSVSLFILGCCLPFTSVAQLLTNNNIQLTLTPGAQLTVKGDILNTAGTAVSNSGTIDLSGNWTHNGGNNCFGVSTGTVIFNGGTQSIDGTDETVFNNLRFTGSGTKTLLQNTTAGGGNALPSGQLDVTTVAVDLNSHRLLITNPASLAVTGTTGYLISEDADHSSTITWRINTSTGNHLVPFGTSGGILIPFLFNLVSGNAGDVSLSTYPTAPTNTPLPVTPTPVTHVRSVFGTNNSANTVDRFWEIGSTGTPTADFTFTYAPAENAANGNSNVRAQHWTLPDSAWGAPLPGQWNPTPQSVTVPGATLFGPWALAVEDSPLPIQLIAFNAEAVNNERVVCRWITATETNNDYFTIEKSRNGITFEACGRVDGAGNSTSVLNYDYTDPAPFKGISYYRLKQTDFDGNFSYSQIEKVFIRDVHGSGVALYPNPSSGIFHVRFDETQLNIANAVFEIFDLQGKIAAKIDFSDLQSIEKNVVEINATHLNPAIYFYRLTNNLEIVAQGKLEILNDK